MKIRPYLAMLAAAATAVSVAGTVGASAQEKLAGLAYIPTGTFAMGDHHGFVDPKHGSDETPIHTVRLDAFYIGIYDVTTREYCGFLNAALAQHHIEVWMGGVYLVGGSDLLCDTRASSPSSEVGWDGNRFSVLDQKENRPMVCVRWHGAAVYCNWLSAQKRDGYAPHHDWVRIFNRKINAPTTLYIANKSITHEQAIAAGADPRKGPYRDGQMDAVVEVDMQGNVVWEWWFFDHVVQDVDSSKPNYVGAGKTIADHPGRININMPGRSLKRDWLHCIRLGLPGAGHLMVFNNGQYLYQRTPQSSALEINPFLDASGRDTGKYVNPPDAGYRRVTYDHDTHNQPRQISKQIVWSYQSINSHGFFSHIGSSVQRLPNGGTFICSDTEGHFFEVTADGQLAWEYINPVTRDGAVKGLGDVLPMVNSAFRAYRYAAEHPAFKGRDLTPKSAQVMKPARCACSTSPKTPASGMTWRRKCPARSKS